MFIEDYGFSFELKHYQNHSTNLNKPFIYRKTIKNLHCNLKAPLADLLNIPKDSFLFLTARYQNLTLFDLTLRPWDSNFVEFSLHFIGLEKINHPHIVDPQLFSLAELVVYAILEYAPLVFWDVQSIKK